MGRLLIVNADDFGLTPGVNNGIVTAFQHGIVTSTTLMVNMPGFSHAVALAKRLPGLDVGLHLNLTYGHPVSPPEQVPSLLGPKGTFVKDPKFVLGNGRVEEMSREFRAQLRRFISAGLPLSHIDTHHDLHRTGRVLDLIADLAKASCVHIRCLDEEAQRSRGLWPRASFTKFFGDREGVARLLEIIRKLPEGATEIPCHPGYVDDELRSLSTLTYVRERELAALLDPRVRVALDEGGVRLTTYAELGSNGPALGTRG